MVGNKYLDIGETSRVQLMHDDIKYILSFNREEIQSIYKALKSMYEWYIELGEKREAKIIKRILGKIYPLIEGVENV